MEQIKVNMIPNGEVKTIHCSKGDGKTRKWGFELYKEDGIIPASSISPQMFFDSYKGGIEEILPENTDTPTTSPIIADIQYPDALRSEQEFLYRESPTQADGKAKITKIKGNTLAFNQLVQNGNFADTSVWTTANGSFTVANNKATFKAIAQYGSMYLGTSYRIKNVTNHKLLFTFKAKSYSNSNTVALLRFAGNTTTTETFALSITETEYSRVCTVPNDNTIVTNILFQDNNSSGWGNIEISNVMVVDLTQLNNSAITDATSFRTYYNLPYYAFNLGSLLSFNGTGLKTIGKNLFDKSTPISIGQYVNDTWDIPTNRITTDYIRIIPNIDYTMFVDLDDSADFSFVNYNYFDGNKTWLGNRSTNGDSSLGDLKQKTFNIHNGNAMFLRVTFWSHSNHNADISSRTLQNANFQLEFGSTATSYEEYTTSTLSLPISTYFPTGMKSAGSVYDELTPNKATTRMGSYTFTGTELFFVEANTRFYVVVTDYIPVKIQIKDTSANVSNAVCDKYEVTSQNKIPVDAVRKTAFTQWGDKVYCYFSLDGLTTADAFKTWLSNNPVTIYYELATYTETTINTASLVSEQAEIPLYEDDDILIGECTTQLSSKSGFIPTKIKYQDDTGVAYSQKINLHVENEL